MLIFAIQTVNIYKNEQKKTNVNNIRITEVTSLTKNEKTARLYKYIYIL